MNEIPARYAPKDTEDKWYKFWEERNFFSAGPNPARKPFSIVIPPPNITGILHIGHALNNTIQDILVRYHRMKGEEALWMPGTDHAGIATQNVVEKSLAKEGLRRKDLGREKFIEKVWLWRELYGKTIIRQLKKLGASCDWSRIRFTMDEEYSKAVKTVFVSLWQKGLVYQDNKVINWCPRCQTALSDEEAPHREVQGNLYYIRYPLRDVNGLAGERVSGLEPANLQTRKPANFIVVATTRPETMLGDTAVAVNPKDRRYKKIIGKSLILPLANREIKIIADSIVDMKFASGAVKVTPACDPNDYILGKKHKLEFINLMRPDGRLNQNAGDYRDMDRFEARRLILEDLKEKGLLEKVEPHIFSAGHCYRCHTIIEPYLCRQWFVKMRPLAKPAIAAVKKGKIRFHPKRWRKVYLNWMENIEDWCISRQIWWGHRIPLWYCLDCKKEALAAVEQPTNCRVCKSTNLKQDEDVLDTWFSSWLWPFATFGWPFTSSDDRRRQDLEYFYPTSALVTAPEIIFFWVARMIMAGLEFMQDIPFRDIYIHGTVRDIEGKKMSKSLGNIIDPLEIISEYGADALRFSLISITAQGQDVFLSKERFEQGRNFANKVWNAARFILMNLETANKERPLSALLKKGGLDIVNRWILSRFYSVLKSVNRDLDNYKFNEAANRLYGFFWHEFCDWCLELAKPALSDSPKSILRRNTQVVLYAVLEKFLKVLHPFMPFITEELWQKLQDPGPERPLVGTDRLQAASIMKEGWPDIEEQVIDKETEKQMESLIKIIRKIRDLYNYIGMDPTAKEVRVSYYPYNKRIEGLIKENAGLIREISKLFSFIRSDEDKNPPATIHSTIEGVHLFLHFSGSLDLEKIRIKKEVEINNLQRNLDSKKALLKNKNFVNKAPKEIVEKEKENKSKLEVELNELKKIFSDLF